MKHFILGMEFSDWKEVDTKRGKMLVRSATPSETFWKKWKSGATKKGRGKKLHYGEHTFSVSKFRDEWQVSEWQKPAEYEEEKEAKESQQGSVSLAHSDTKVFDFVDDLLPEGEAFFGFQREGVSFAVRRREERDNVIIADEMGLGKTIQAIGCINALSTREYLAGTVPRVLIVVPAYLKLQWKERVERWATMPGDHAFNVAVTNGDFPTGADIVITNYAQLKKWNKEIRMRGEWDLLILDESHYIKNRDSQRTRLVTGGKIKGERFFPIQAKWKVFLTGTPLNKPKELYTSLKYLAPDRFPEGFHEFGKKYCGAHHNGWGWVYDGSDNEEELRRRLAPIMIRRKKSEVLKDLPDKMRKFTRLDAADYTAELSEELSARRALEDVRQHKQQLSNIREAQNTAFARLAKARVATAEAKLKDALKVVKEHVETGNKLVVFAHHKVIVEKTKAFLDALKVNSVVITGDVDAATGKRKERQDAFQEDENVQVLVGTIGAAGTGIDLTAASTAVFLEISWTPIELKQAEDRLHRIGQDESVLIEYVVLEGSADDLMLQKIFEKEEIQGAVLGDDIELHRDYAEEDEVTLELT